MDKKDYKILKRETVFPNEYRQVDKISVQMPDGNVHDIFQTVVKDSVMVLPITDDGMIVLNDQYNMLFELRCFELCAGFIEEDEEPSETAKKELKEETGYGAKKFTKLGKAYVERWSSNAMTFYLAEGAYKMGEQELELTEDINVVLRSVDDVKTMLRNCEIINGPTVTCLYMGFDQLGLL